MRCMNEGCIHHSTTQMNYCMQYYDTDKCDEAEPRNLPEANVKPQLCESWRDVRKELPVTPFLGYWTDGRITVLEDGDSVAYAITGDPNKRVIAWIPLSEIGKPAFA